MSLVITVKKLSTKSMEATMLMEELSDQLEYITGASGKSSFSEDDVEKERGVFAVAFLDGQPAGCGGIREMTEDTAELKRMYARYPKRGIGTRLLLFLEQEAKKLGYGKIMLETRKVNQKAVEFYLKSEYQVCENYGRYVGKEEAVCFSKNI